MQRSYINPLANSQFITGQVLCISADELIVQSLYAGQLKARKAQSCWFELKKHDRVLVLLEADQAWVVSLLETDKARSLRVTQDEIQFQTERFMLIAGESYRMIQGHDQTECESQLVQAQSLLKREAALSLEQTQQSAITTEKFLINTS